MTKKSSQTKSGLGHLLTATGFFLKVPSYLLVFLIVLLALLHFVLSSHTIMRPILNGALPAVGDLIGAEIKVGYFSLSLVPTHLEIRDAVFTRKNDTYRIPFSGAEKIIADLSFFDLIRGRIHVNRVDVWGGWNYLYIDEEGLANLPDFPSSKDKEDKPPKKDGIRFPLLVDQAVLHDARYAMDMPGIDMTIEVEGVNGTAFCDMFQEQKTGADITISHVDFRMDKITQIAHHVEAIGHFSFRDFSVFAEHVFIETEEATASAYGGLWDIRTNLAMAYWAKAEARLSAVNRMFTQEPKLDGTVSTEVTLFSKMPELAIHGTVAMDEGRANDLLLQQLNGAFRLDLDSVSLDRLSVRAAGGRIEADGVVDYSDGLKLDTNTKLYGVSVGTALEGYGIHGIGLDTKADGQVKASYTSAGEGAWQAKADLGLQDVRYNPSGDVPIVSGVDLNVSAAVRMAGDSIAVDEALIKSLHTTVKAEGFIGLPEEIDGNFLISSMDLSDFSPVLGQTLGGVLNASGTVSGSFSELDLDLTALGKNLHYGGYSLDGLATEMAMAKSDLNIKRLLAEKGETKLKAEGSIGLTGGPDLDVELRCEDGRLEDVGAIIDRELDLAGKFNLGVRLWGPLKTMGGKGTATLGKAVLYGEEVNGLEMAFSADDGTVSIDEFVVHKRNAEIVGSGTLRPIDGTMDLTLATRDLMLGHISRISDAGIPAEASIDMDLLAQGSFTNPLIRSTIQIQNTTYDGDLIGSGNVSLLLEDWVLDADVDLFEGRIAADGQLLLDQGLQYDASLFFDQLKIERFAPLLGSLDSLTGILDADLNFQGRLDDVDTLRLQGDVDLLQLTLSGVTIQNEMPMGLTYEDGAWRFKNASMTGEGFDLFVVGGTEGGENFVSVMLETELGLFREFSTSIADASGDLEAEFQFFGSLTEPRLLGFLVVTDGALDIINSPQPLYDIQLSVDFTTNKYSINELSMKTGGGKINGGGEILVKNLVPYKYDLFLKGQEIQTGYAPYMEAKIRLFDLFLTGRDGLFDLAGDVYLDEAVYSKNLDWRTILSSFQTETVAVEVFKRRKEKFLTLNVAIHAEDNLRFENNLADIELGAELILTGDDQNIGLLGDVNVLQGEASVLSGNYEITSGLIQFFNEKRIYPVFDITGETTVNEVFIVVNVSGTADRYNIAFNSDPPKSEQDIVALLSLGISYEEFQQKVQGQNQESTTAEGAAIGAAAKVLGSQLGEYANRIAGLQITVDTSTGVSRLKISKEIQKDLVASYFWELLGAGVMAQLEYNFFSFMALVATWQNDPTLRERGNIDAFGGGIKFMIDFQ